MVVLGCLVIHCVPNGGQATISEFRGSTSEKGSLAWGGGVDLSCGVRGIRADFHAPIVSGPKEG